MFLKKFSIEREEVGEAPAPALQHSEAEPPDCKTPGSRNEGNMTCVSPEPVSLFPCHQGTQSKADYYLGLPPLGDTSHDAPETTHQSKDVIGSTPVEGTDGC